MGAQEDQAVHGAETGEENPPSTLEPAAVGSLAQKVAESALLFPLSRTEETAEERLLVARRARLHLDRRSRVKQIVRSLSQELPGPLLALFSD